MASRKTFESWYQSLHNQFISHPAYQQLSNNTGKRKDVIKLVENICKAHLKSPQILAFLYSIAPPNSILHVKENLLEELGHYNNTPSHPALLYQVGRAVGFSDTEFQTLEHAAESVLKNKIIEPLMFGSIKETGLNVMLETFSFEWFLSREASNMGNIIKKYLDIDDKGLCWFHLHSQVDVKHAEEGFTILEEYINYYDIDKDTLQNIGEITFRENVFLKRYFDIQQATLI